MSVYISSNSNRFYAALESSYGQAATASPNNRFPGIGLQAQQVVELGRRVDKTGTRTFQGSSKSGRRQTAFQARTYLTSWNGTGEPCYGALFRAALGSAGQFNSGLEIASAQSATQLVTKTPHGLWPGGAISYANEIRFVVSVPDTSTLILNAPLSTVPTAGSVLAPTITYRPATALPSVTLYDYWGPPTAVSRIVTGAAVDFFEAVVNGDYHEFTFSGPAADLLDPGSFVAGTAGLNTFPPEPGLTQLAQSMVPGHLGQVWLGSTATRFFTLTEASVQVRNHLDLRNQEFGSSYPRAISAGMREVTSKFVIFAQDDAQSAALYAAAKSRTAIPAMLQLGQQQGQLMGIYMRRVMPEIPTYDDSETRLQWEFKNNLAQGFNDDEIHIAFA